jgi:hypothetical protein
MKRRNLMFIPAAVAVLAAIIALTTDASTEAEAIKANAPAAQVRPSVQSEELPMDRRPISDMATPAEMEPLKNRPNFCHPMTGCKP